MYLKFMQEISVVAILMVFSFASFAQDTSQISPTSLIKLEGSWQLVFCDEFDSEEYLDANWDFQNGPSGHILASRWRENAVIEDGILKLVGRKEMRGGQEWTAASLWTKKKFKYGYYECRYKLLPSTGTNNSFWLNTRERSEAIAKAKAQGLPTDDIHVPGQFEIDICEGHYPNEVNMNLHNWSGEHWSKGDRWYYNPSDDKNAVTRLADDQNQGNLSQDFHVYSLLWTEDELVYYFDGQEIRRVDQEIARGEAAVYLSLAIMQWAGKVTDDIDGKSMDVDYVRVWQQVDD